MEPVEINATINAVLNFCSPIFLSLGFYFIKKKQQKTHQAFMWAAVVTSAVFLASYLYRHLNYEPQRFVKTGFIKWFYYGLLGSHVILAAFIPLGAFFLLRYIYKGANYKHKNLAVWVWPAWIYVSITGIGVYFMLFS